MGIRNRATGNAAVLAALLLGFLALMSYQANRAQTLTSAKAVVFGVASPVQRLLSLGLLGTSGIWDRYVGVVGASREADDLREQLDEYQRREDRLSEIEQENRRLRDLLDLSAYTDPETIAAAVIGRDLEHRFESLVLDRGWRDGIQANAPVLSPEGALVGRVVSVAPWTCMVQLVTAPLSAVGARLADSPRSTGVVHGAGSAALKLEYISSRDDVAPGDLVITSGDDGIYSAGIALGEVAEVTVGPPIPGTPRVPLARDEAALFKEIVLVPRADVLRLQDVLVLPALEPRAVDETDDDPLAEPDGA